MRLSVPSRSVADTAAVARALAPHLRAGDVVLLDGDVAAGKTAFVAALAATLGAAGPVTSPTYAIAQFYPCARAPILHMDVYRLDDMAAFRDLALDEHFPDAITLIEWGEKVAAAFPEHLSVRIALDGDARTLTLTPFGARWTAAFPAIARALAC
jgi:tRNA threonylcarbamoyladenosine biosynthesis protein TsaE